MKRFKEYISINEWRLSHDSLEKTKKIKPIDYNELRMIAVERYEKTIKNKQTYLDLTDIDVSDITSFGDEYKNEHHVYNNSVGLFSFFYGIKIIDLTGWKTDKVESLRNMFYNCKDLEHILGIEDFNTKNIKQMSTTFAHCESLISLHLDKWDTSRVNTMSNMFYGCKKLKTITGIDNWNTQNVTDIVRMFCGCYSLRDIDLNNWNVTGLEYNAAAFENCDKNIIPKWW